LYNRKVYNEQIERFENSKNWILTFKKEIDQSQSGFHKEFENKLIYRDYLFKNELRFLTYLKKIPLEVVNEIFEYYLIKLFK